MPKGCSLYRTIAVLAFALICPASFGAATFRVATYNVENYLDHPTTGRRHAKTARARAKVRESIRALNPDVLALQEMGSLGALQELRRTLKADGLEFPYWEFVRGFDTNSHLAILSKFPITGRRSHTEDSFLLGGRRFRVCRGIAEVDIRVNPAYSLTVITAHLKSKRPVPEADEAEQRRKEAVILRHIVDADLKANPRANLIVLGDFNDTKDSASTRTIIGRGRFKLRDTRPAERNGDAAAGANRAYSPRRITWTHYYGKEDSYSRIDYVLLSPGLAREWLARETYVLTIPDWGIGSDHRPLVATFHAEDK